MVFRFPSKFWLNWKNYSGEDILFLKHFYFPINFINFMEIICVDQVFLKNSGFQSGKKNLISTKIPDQEFKSWSIKYLKLKIKSRSWYIHDFFKPVSKSAISTSPFNAAVLGYFDILIFWYFDIFFNNFSQTCFFNSNFQVAHMRYFHHIFFCVEAKRWSHWQNIYWKSTSN